MEVVHIKTDVGVLGLACYFRRIGREEKTRWGVFCGWIFEGMKGAVDRGGWMDEERVTRI